MSEFAVAVFRDPDERFPLYGSAVYAVDTNNQCFLLVNPNGRFEWAPIKNCLLITEENEDDLFG